MKIIKIEGGYVTEKDIRQSAKDFIRDFKNKHPNAKFEDFFEGPVELGGTMDFEDYETLQAWLVDKLEENGEKWSDVIYHNLTEEELSKKWSDDVQRIYIWTKDFVYFHCDSDEGIILDHVDRNPPIPIVNENG